MILGYFLLAQLTINIVLTNNCETAESFDLLQHRTQRITFFKIPQYSYHVMKFLSNDSY